jgi:uncharacterized protein (DUF779 family)
VSFQPSVEVDRSAFNLKVTRQEFPVGIAGVRLSLSEMAKRIREGGRTPSVRAFGEFIVRNAGFPANVSLTHMQYAEAFLTYMQQNVRYAPDPVMTEFNQCAECTLCTPGAPMCIPVGDCDDVTVALGALLMAAGVPVRIVKQTFGAEDQEHVLLQFQTEGGDWVYADPSVKDKAVGWHAPASEEVTVDPLDAAAIGMVSGTPEAEFIGVGKPPHIITRALDGAYFPMLPAQQWPWRGIGAAAAPAVDPYADAQTALTTTNTVILAGDSAFNAGNDWAGAVNSYQAAGDQGFHVVGPAIDQAGAPSITQPITQQAASLNATLQALNGTSSTQIDAQTAQGLAKQMASLYAQAIDAGRATQASGGGMTFAQKIWAAVAIGAVLGSGYAYYQSTKGQHPALGGVAKKKRKARRTHRLAHRRGR